MESLHEIVEEIKAIHEANRIPLEEKLPREMSPEGMDRVILRIEDQHRTIQETIVGKNLYNRIADLPDSVLSMKAKTDVLHLLHQGSINIALMLIQKEIWSKRPAV